MSSRVQNLALMTFVAFAAAPLDVSAQCSLCRRALESGGGQGLLDGFYWSILLMLAVPTILFATVTTLLVRAHRAKVGRHSSPSESV